jgi:hypothetical protein
MRYFRWFFTAILLVASLAALAWAGDPWKDKSYRKWDRKDVAKILNDSPWAKTVTVTANWRSKSVMVNPIVTTQGGAMNGPSGLGMRVRAQSAKFEARWVSSLTLREAIVRKAVLEGKLTEAEAERELSQAPVAYQVTLLGADMTPFSKLGLASVLSDAFLELQKTKRKLEPSSYKPEYSADGARLLSITFSFPVTVGGQPAIAPGETRIDFICRVKKEKVDLEFHFDPRKMTAGHGRDL